MARRKQVSKIAVFRVSYIDNLSKILKWRIKTAFDVNRYSDKNHRRLF